MVSSQKAQKSRNCFDFPLAGDGSWAGAAGQGLVTAVTWTGHGLGTPKTQVMSDDIKDKARETKPTEI